MSKATQDKQPDTPTTQVINKAMAPTQVEDSLGRTIKLRKPGVLAQFRLIEMLGGHASTNDVYMGMVAPLMYISAIDDDDAIVIGTKTELEALIQRLGEEGIQAVMEKVKAVYGVQEDPKAAADKIKKQQPAQ